MYFDHDEDNIDDVFEDGDDANDDCLSRRAARVRMGWCLCVFWS